MVRAMSKDQQAELEVFVEAKCSICQRALRMAADVDDRYPELSVRVIDISEPAAQRDDVFAVPTFILDGRVVSLGNPKQSFLRSEIETLLQRRSSR